jgi:hypothetical protein
MVVFVGLFGYAPEGCCKFSYLIGLGLFLIILYVILERISPKKKAKKVRIKKHPRKKR